MRCIRYITTLLFLWIGTMCNAQTLEEYLQLAAKNNPKLKAKYAEFEATLQKVTKANSWPDPNISFGYFISPVETRVGPQRARIGLSQMIPWFGTLKTFESVLQLQAEAKYQEFLDARNELFMQVKSAWYPLCETTQNGVLQKKNREILILYKQLAVTNFKNGKSSMVNVIRVDIMIENTHTQIKLLEDQLKPLQAYFNQLLGRADTLSIVVSDSITISHVANNDYQKDSLLIHHPIVQSFDLKIQSAQKAEKLANKKGMPKFVVGLDYVLVGERTDINVPNNGKNIAMPVVSLSVPLYRSKYKAAVREAQLNQEAITHYKEAFKNNMFSNYEKAQYEMKKSKDLIRSYNKQIEKTNQAMTLLMTSYSHSGKDFEEILSLQQELLKYQIAKTAAVKTYYIALAKLDYITAKSE